MQRLPELDDSKRSVRFAILQTVGITLLILIGIVFFANWWIDTTIELEKADIESNLIQIMTITRRAIEPELVSYRNGNLSRSTVMENIEQKLRGMTFKDKHGENYIFLVSYDGYILVQPYQPGLENTNQWNMQDQNGKYLIREIIKTARSQKAGFLTYFYEPPNFEHEEEKLSYVIDIPELEAVIGTGLYMRPYYENQTITISRVKTVTIVLSFLILMTTLSALWRIRNTGKKLEKEIHKRGEVQIHLQESEKDLRTVFNSLSDAFFVHSVDGDILEVNNSVLTMFGCTREEIIGKTISYLANPPDFHEDRLKEIWKKTLNGEDFIMELRALRFDTKKPFFVEAALQKGNWRGQDVILAVVRDIQNRKFIERELLQNQMINEHAEQMAFLGHYSIDLKTQEFKWSKGLYRVFGRDESLPAPDFDEYYNIVLADDVERVKALRLEMYEKNQPYSVEYRIKRSDGEIRDILAQVDWLGEDDDPKRYLIGSIQDITERKKAICEITEREEKFRSTVQQMSDGLLLLDDDGLVIEWNSAYERITEIPSETVIGRPIWDILPMLGIESKNSIKIDRMQAEILKSVRTGKSYIFEEPMEIAIRTKSGKNRILLQSMFPIHTTSTYRLGVISRDITEEKASLEKINHELKKLAGLRSIDATILERSTPEQSMELVCSIAVNLLDVDGAIILTRLTGNDLSSAYQSRIDTDNHPVISGQMEQQKATFENQKNQNEPINFLEIINQVQQAGPVSDNELEQATLPLFINKKVSGYIQVLSRRTLPDDQEWMDFFQTLAGQASLAIENATLIANEELAYDELHHAYEATIAGWSKALELRDEETKGHSDRVMELACRLAKQADYPEERLIDFRRGVLLHDIGKMGIPDRILLKPGPLTDEEWVIMKQHPVFAYNLLSTIPYLADSLDVPYLHHERWNGSGYPLGLKGRDIPLSARIFAIVDVWDALISDRPYRHGWEPDRIREYLVENKEVLFDPDLVDLFLEILDKYATGGEFSR